MVVMFLAAARVHAQDAYERVLAKAEDLLADGRPDLALRVFGKLASDGSLGGVVRAKVMLGMGVCQWQLGDDSHAEKAWHTAKAAALEAGKEGRPMLAQAFSLLGTLYESRGDYEMALELSLKALEINRSLPDLPPGELAYGYNNIGAIYFDKYDFEKAIDFYRQSFLGYMKDGLRVEAALPQTNLGLALVRMEEFEAALGHFREAEAGVLEDGDPALAASLYNNWALACVQTDSIGRALGLLERVLGMSGAPGSQRTIAMANMGFAYLRDGDAVAAEDWLRRALGVGEGGLKAGRRAKVLHHLSEALSMLGRNEEAVAAADEGVGLLMGGPVSNIMELRGFQGQVSERRTLFQLLAAKANAQSVNGQLEEALEHYDMAMDVVDSMREDVSSRGSKRFLMGFVLPVIESALEVEWRIKMEGSDRFFGDRFCFRWFERNKALLLQADRRAAMHLGESAIPIKVLEELNALRADIDFYAQKVYESKRAGDSAAILRFEESLFEKRIAYDAMRQGISERYFEWEEESDELFGRRVEEVQSVCMANQTTFITYFWGKKRVYAMVIHEGDERFLRLCKTEDIEGTVRELAASLADWNWILRNPVEAEKQFKQWSKMVSDSLLAPVFKGGMRGRMMVVPDGPLSLLPFEALPLPGAELGNGLREFPFLIREKIVSYNWSAALFLEGPLRVKVGGKVLAFAPMAGNGFSGDGSGLEELPETQAELKAIAQYCRGKFMLGTAATKEAFLREAPQYGILHLALHGEVAAGDGAFSSLRFACANCVYQASFQADGEDSLLRAYEIERLRLAARLVVLSACETGAGQLSRGEGVLSLGRSFIAQGAETVVTTLWKVEDKAAANLMGEFYKGLAEGKGRGAALREAKLRYLAEADDFTAHPAFWAGFVLMGDDGVIELEKPANWEWMWWAIGISLGVGIGVWRYLKYLGKSKRV
jgi:CHAT domain-containing protein